MHYVECPEVYSGNETSLFLAGGISGCPDWQAEIVELLRETDLVLINPRRKNFPIHDPKEAEFQIRWEYEHLRKATAILFWFPCETLCPITLYELGAWSMTAKTIFIGIHPDYQRRLDVEIQSDLTRPDVPPVYSLTELARLVSKFMKKLY